MIKHEQFKTEITVPLTGTRLDIYVQEIQPDDVEIDITVNALVKTTLRCGDIEDQEIVEYFEILPDGREIELKDKESHDLVLENVSNNEGVWK